MLATAAALAIPSFPLVSSADAPSPSAKPTTDPCGNIKSKWAHKQCEDFNSSAPGDEYFGRMKMSYLGINNTFKDGTISAGQYTTNQGLISKLAFADEALTRWAAKYPGDPQLARTYFLGVGVFRKVYTQWGQGTAWRYIQMLVHKYQSTYFGKTMKASVAHGFTEHWFADAQPCPTPTPKGATPAPTPMPLLTPVPAPGSPAVDIINPPCFQPSPPPSPTPSPTPTPNTNLS